MHSQVLGGFVRPPSSPQQALTLALEHAVDDSVAHPKAVFGSSGWGEGMTGGRDQGSLEVEPRPV